MPESGFDTDIRELGLFAVEWRQATRPGRRARLAFLCAGPEIAPPEEARDCWND
ncbi:hypothetical protein [Streptomyces sulphureus]|uniref:hypothetical protein n=1 Tax=Streptomyces sulphureus TaxID=47758 RepID=UPI00037F378C|nr:hypothetical protein [Streptomyces sulphureus]